jgi:hypothetical protein
VTNEQRDILERAAEALAVQEQLRKQVRENEAELRALCRSYDRHFGLWGCAPHHLRLAVEKRELLDKAV